MSKTTIYILSGIILLLIIAAVVLTLFVRSGNKMPNQYVVSVDTTTTTQTFSLKSGNETRQILDKDLSKYVSYGFNSVHDIIWVNCASGYKISNELSTTGNNVLNNDPVGRGVEILEKQNNNFTFTCSKGN